MLSFVFWTSSLVSQLLVKKRYAFYAIVRQLYEQMRRQPLGRGTVGSRGFLFLWLRDITTGLDCALLLKANLDTVDEHTQCAQNWNECTVVQVLWGGIQKGYSCKWCVLTVCTFAHHQQGRWYVKWKHFFQLGSDYVSKCERQATSCRRVWLRFERLRRWNFFSPLFPVRAISLENYMRKSPAMLLL